MNTNSSERTLSSQTLSMTGSAYSNSTSTATNRAPSQTSTIVVTQTAEVTGNATTNSEEVVLPLTLRGRATVTWDQNVEDNEGLGRKKSKRCCIFHKQRDFGESSTSSDNDDGNDSDSSSSSGGEGFSTKKPRRRKEKRRPIARPKKGSKVPDYQRYHA